MKTLVELFDSCQIANVIAPISLNPEKVIFLGDETVMAQERKEALERFFRMRKQKITIQYVSVQLNSYQDILKKMNQILSMNSDICIDITGGREVPLIALGETAYCHNLPLICFDIETGDMKRIKNAQKIPKPAPAKLTVRQSVVLNGGEIVDPDRYMSVQQFTPSFSKEICSLFEISRQDPKGWNQFVIALEGLLNSARVTSDLKVCANISSISETQYQKLTEYSLLEQLADAGLILQYQNSGEMLSFRYKNEQVHQCMSKAGNILEVYTYLLLHDILKENPTLFCDIRMGVCADWDGKLIPKHKSGTKNEIDLIVTKNAIPIFISCKHGEVMKEALYELHTVAEHYGGTYAKKVLVTAALSPSPTKRDSFLKRAKDMGITVIYNVHQISKETFKQRLSEIGMQEEAD